MKHQNIKSTFYAGVMTATMMLIAPETANAEGGRGPALPDDPLLPSSDSVYTRATLNDCKAKEKGYSRSVTRSKKGIKKTESKLATAKSAGDKKNTRAIKKELKKNKRDLKDTESKRDQQKKECDLIKAKLKAQ